MNLQPPPGGEAILDDSQLEVPPGGEGILKDAPNDMSAEDWKQSAISLARLIANMHPAAPMVPAFKAAASAAPDAGAGLARGLGEVPEAPGAPMAARAGNAVGDFMAKNTDVMAGSAAGAAASMPFAPIAGPFAPAVPVVGGLIGAASARTLNRAGQVALGTKPMPTTEEAAADLNSAAKQGAMMEAGGQMIEGGIKMGIDGAVALKGAAMEKLREVMPDAGQIMLRIPSESINRVMTRFNEFKPEVKALFSGKRREAQIKADEMGAKALENVGEKLAQARKVAGRKVELAETSVIAKHGDVPAMSFDDITSKLNQFAGENPTLAGDLGKIQTVINAAKPAGQGMEGGGGTISVAQAIKLKQRLQRLSEYNPKGGIRQIEHDAANDFAKSLAGEVRESVIGAVTQAKADPRYLSRLNEFHQLADKYDGALDVLRTVSGSDKALAARFKNLVSTFNEGGGPQQALMNIGKDMPGGKAVSAAIDELVDVASAASFTKVPTVVPSSLMLRAINAVVPTRTAVGALGSAASSGAKASPSAPAVGSVIARKLSGR